MKAQTNPAAQKAMRIARKLARMKRRRAMAPYVHEWAVAMKESVSISIYGDKHGR
jgi:hypothetical protein